MSNEFPPPPPPPPSYDGPDDASMRNQAVITHAGTLINLISLPGVLVPLIMMLTTGKQSPLVRRNAVESLNFQLSMIIYAIISAILILVLIGFVLLIAVALMLIIFPIIASVRASNGDEYRYPLTIRMVK